MKNMETRGREGEKGNEGFLGKDEIDEILNGESALLVDKAKEVGKEIKSVSSSQIRSFFGTVKKLQMKARMEQSDILGQDEINTLMLLIPKLYYAAARAHGGKMEKLRSDLEEMIKRINGDKKKFFHFCEYLEAVIAYHKAFGGR